MRHHFVRDLLENKLLDIRFQRSEKNSSDILTKNTAKDTFEKHTKKIREGTLDCWKEDVKTDSSVKYFGEVIEDQDNNTEKS